MADPNYWQIACGSEGRDPRDRYPLDPANVPGALEMLRLLLPATAIRNATPTDKV